MSTNTFAPSGVSDAEAASRIAALRRHREERAASSGVVPAVVRMTVDDITDVLDATPKLEQHPNGPTALERQVLDAARSLYGGSGDARQIEIARAIGVSDGTVYSAIHGLKVLKMWPYSTPRGRPSKTAKPKAKPNLSCLDTRTPTPTPAPDAPAAPQPIASPSLESVFVVIDAFDGLPRDAQASLLAYLSRRTTHNTRD